MVSVRDSHVSKLTRMTRVSFDLVEPHRPALFINEAGGTSGPRDLSDDFTAIPIVPGQLLRRQYPDVSPADAQFEPGRGLPLGELLHSIERRHFGNVIRVVLCHALGVGPQRFPPGRRGGVNFLAAQQLA